MEWKDECRISEAFHAVMEKQNNHEDRIQAIEKVIAKIEELIVNIVMALQKKDAVSGERGNRDEDIRCDRGEL